MLRRTNIIYAAFLAALFPAAAQADKFDFKKGSLVFSHAPAVPTGECEDPPGTLYEDVSSNAFFAEFEGKKKDLLFPSGSGIASGCAFDTPLENGAVAAFTGSFVLESAEGDELRGSFEVMDFFPTDFPPEFQPYFPFFFEAVIFITFDGGTGKYEKAKGEAIATGWDFPFVGPFGPGVFAEEVEGRLRLKE